MVSVTKRPAKVTHRKENHMKCPKCKGALRKVAVAVRGASSKVISHQCMNCDYFSFEPESTKKVIEELRE